MKIVGIFLLIFAIGSGVATFIENDFGINSAKAVIYNTHWFEIIMIFLVIAIIFNMFKFKLFRKEKIFSLIFHLSFVIILIGAFITRYYGFEGTMHIREGSESNLLLSSEKFLQIDVNNSKEKALFQEEVLISELGNNNFKYNLNFKDKNIEIKYKDYIPNAEEKIVERDDGEPLVQMAAFVDGSMNEIIIKNNKFININSFIISLNNSGKSNNLFKDSVNIFIKDNKFFMKSNKDIQWFNIDGKDSSVFKANSENELLKGRFYTLNSTQFAFRNLFLKAKKIAVSKDENSNSKNKMMLKQSKSSALILTAKYNGLEKDITIFNVNKNKSEISNIKLDDLNLNIMFGSKDIELPFKIKLIDFQLERYMGSNSPSSYASEVILIDEEKKLNQPFRIYMNNVLDYQGYRFFQSSYDMDEKGTILSVNYDPGTIPTYIGYFLLFLGLALNIFAPKSRFRYLAKQNINNIVMGILLISSLFSVDMKAETDKNINNKNIEAFDLEHSNKFGKLIVQDSSARFKYLSIFNSEILMKISKKDSMFGLNSNQIILGMIVKPQYWQQIRMIKVHHPKLKKILKIKKDEKYFAFKDCFDLSKDVSYILTNYVMEANRKKPSERDEFDKDILKVDERISIAYMVYSGDLLKIFPKDIKNSNNGWVTPKNAIDSFNHKTVEQIREWLSNYFIALQSKQWEKADKVLNEIANYQKEFGKLVIPNQTKLDAELLFDKLKIFQNLMFLYLLAGLALLILIFIKLIKPNLSLNRISKIVLSILIFGFIVHSLGLLLRWYIAEHAPWSNGYESMVYIAWAIILAGIIFSKRSILALSTTGVLAGVTLLVAHLSWMDPQITNLVPVLKSYWLTIHVSVITASYGFLGLSALLGFITLIMIIMLKKDDNKNRNNNIIFSIKEATRINEMSIIIGLSMLTIGNFLGGVWANESWGRYWGWDPKETWALVSILIYAFVLHQRFISKLNSIFAFAVTSTIAYSSIIMTYFGVNFYLSGMHSYAAGDPIPVPSFVYYTITVVLIIIAIAYTKRDLAKYKL